MPTACADYAGENAGRANVWSDSDCEGKILEPETWTDLHPDGSKLCKDAPARNFCASTCEEVCGSYVVEPEPECACISISVQADDLWCAGVFHSNGNQWLQWCGILYSDFCGWSSDSCASDDDHASRTSARTNQPTLTEACAHLGCAPASTRALLFSSMPLGGAPDCPSECA